MTATTRRSVLTLLAAAAAGAAGTVLTRPAPAAAADSYPSNTTLYADPRRTEGADYARRHRRHDAVDDSLAEHVSFPQTAVVAPHGGGIEFGTSELCLAVAGYHPASLAADPADGPRYDYWMFEGLQARDNGELHVTSTHCDDPVAESLCGGARQAVALHGCSTAAAGLDDKAAAVLVGGLDHLLKSYLLEEFAKAEIHAVDAATNTSLSGTHPDNIVNRTVLGMGAQLELTAPLRTSMFLLNTRADRKNTTTPTFWAFVAATRAAIARVPTDRPRA